MCFKSDYFPLNFNEINLNNSTHLPSTAKTRNNAAYAYWMRALFERVCYVIKFIKWPKRWKGPQKVLFLYTIFKWGFGVVSYDPKFWYFFQPCSLSGYDFLYSPTDAILANPKLSKTMKIGEECEIVKLTHDYQGIWDVLDYYATKLAGLDGSLQVALINSKNSYFLMASNKSAANGLKRALDLINQGEPAIVYDSRALIKPNTNGAEIDPIQQFDLNVDKNVKVIGDLIQDIQLILKMFDTEIGIQTSGGNIQKRLTSYEAESNQQECLARCTEWVECLNESFEKVHELYPELDIRVELNPDAICRDKEEKKDGGDVQHSESVRTVS